MSGERLTRDEAFDLLRRTVAALTTGDVAVRASVVRGKARELLTRDSESLSDRNFPRILKDAHDNDVIDLRRRGDDFEVARVSEAESVAEQLAKTAISNAPVPVATAAVPRGMGHRGGVNSRGRGAARPGAPSAALLSIGMVGQSSSAATAAAEPAVASVQLPVAAAPVSTDAEPSPVVAKSTRKTAAKKSAAAKSPAAKAPAAKRPVVKATATKTKAGAGVSPAAKKAAPKPRAKKAVARNA